MSRAQICFLVQEKGTKQWDSKRSIQTVTEEKVGKVSEALDALRELVAKSQKLTLTEPVVFARVKAGKLPEKIDPELFERESEILTSASELDLDQWAVAVRCRSSSGTANVQDMLDIARPLLPAPDKLHALSLSLTPVQSLLLPQHRALAAQEGKVPLLKVKGKVELDLTYAEPAKEVSALLRRVLEARDIATLVQCSGSGKTTTIVNLLQHTYGFYFLFPPPGQSQAATSNQLEMTSPDLKYINDRMQSQPGDSSPQKLWDVASHAVHVLFVSRALALLSLLKSDEPPTPLQWLLLQRDPEPSSPVRLLGPATLLHPTHCCCCCS